MISVHQSVGLDRVRSVRRDDVAQDVIEHHDGDNDNVRLSKKPIRLRPILRSNRCAVLRSFFSIPRSGPASLHVSRMLPHGRFPLADVMCRREGGTLRGHAPIGHTLVRRFSKRRVLRLAESGRPVARTHEQIYDSSTVSRLRSRTTHAGEACGPSRSPLWSGALEVSTVGPAQNCPTGRTA